MTSGSVGLSTIQQTLSNMQIAAALPATDSSPVVPGDSFATTLVQATNDLSSTGGGLFIGYPGGGTGISTVADASLSAGGSAQEMSLTALLLSTRQSAGSLGVSSSASTTQAIASAVGGVTGSDVVNTAAQFEGTPYVWGGSTPKGFDCSGLVQYVYGQLGINLPRTSQEQARVGTPVAALSSAQPGDLLYFAGSDGTISAPGHVGIYVGNGEMIDAPYTGTRVQMESISSAGSVVAIRRILAGA